MKNEPTARKLMRGNSDEPQPTDYKPEHNNEYTSPVLVAPSHHLHGIAGEEKEKRTRSRKWSDEEVDLFLNILGDARYMFAASLENLVPKKRSNYEIFTNIKNVFRRELKERQRERCPGFEYSMSLDLSIEKLRKKYSNLKVEWRRMNSDRKGKEDCQLPEPRWYRSVQKLMTDIQIASEKLNRMASIDDGSQTDENNGDCDLKSNNGDIEEGPTFVVISNRSSVVGKDASMPIYSISGDNVHQTREYAYETMQQVNGDRNDNHGEEENRHSPTYISRSDAQSSTIYTRTRPPPADCREYQYPYKRLRMTCCDGGAMPTSKNVNELADGLKQLAELQMKRQQMIIEADFKTYDLFLRHKEQEAEKNRTHELKLADIYAKALTGSHIHPQSEVVSPPLSYQRRNNNEQGTFRTLSDVEREMTSPSFISQYDG